MEASADVVSPSSALVIPFAPAWRGERATALLSEKSSAARRIATADDDLLVGAVHRQQGCTRIDGDSVAVAVKAVDSCLCDDLFAEAL